MTTSVEEELGKEFTPEAVDPQHSRHDRLRQRIADLSDESIHALSRETLTVAVRAAELTFWQHVDEERLRYSDRPTLERLAFLARRACRNGDDDLYGITFVRRKPR